MNGTEPKAELPRFRVNAGAASDRGLERSSNQDKMSRFRTALGEVFIVADGMGGYEGGEVAAGLVVHGFERYLKGVTAETRLETALQEACRAANQEIIARSSSGQQNVRGMGSTVVLAVIGEETYVIAHVGDSRAYLLQDGQLVRLTKDHSFVQRLVDAQTITEEEAAGHPQASVLTRAFGQDKVLELEIAAPRTIQPGQYILLCSDGLSGYIADPDIARAMQGATDPGEMTSRLIKQALAAGGKDNVTVQVVHFAPRPVVTPAPSVPAEDEPPRPRRTWLWTLFVIVALVAGLVAGVFLGAPIRNLFHRPPPPPAAQNPAVMAQKPKLRVNGTLSPEALKALRAVFEVTGGAEGPAGAESSLYCKPDVKSYCDQIRAILAEGKVHVTDTPKERIAPDLADQYDGVLEIQVQEPGRGGR
jgi:protein phosphatase